MLSYYLLMLWWILAVGFNVLSYLQLQQGLIPYTPTDPIVGVAFVSLVLPILWGMKRGIKLCFLLMLVYLVILSVSGVFSHVFIVYYQGNISEYASVKTFAVGVSLNVLAVMAGAKLLYQNRLL